MSIKKSALILIFLVANPLFGGRNNKKSVLTPTYAFLDEKNLEEILAQTDDKQTQNAIKTILKKRSKSEKQFASVETITLKNWLQSGLLSDQENYVMRKIIAQREELVEKPILIPISSTSNKATAQQSISMEDDLEDPFGTNSMEDLYSNAATDTHSVTVEDDFEDALGDKEGLWLDEFEEVEFLLEISNPSTVSTPVVSPEVSQPQILSRNVNVGPSKPLPTPQKKKLSQDKKSPNIKTEQQKKREETTQEKNVFEKIKAFVSIKNMLIFGSAAGALALGHKIYEYLTTTELDRNQAALEKISLSMEEQSEEISAQVVDSLTLLNEKQKANLKILIESKDFDALSEFIEMIKIQLAEVEIQETLQERIKTNFDADKRALMNVARKVKDSLFRKKAESFQV